MDTAPLSDPYFQARFFGEVSPDGKSYRGLLDIEGAQGLMFACPCGYGEEGPGPHMIMVCFSNPRNAPQLPADFGPHSLDQGKGVYPRWTMKGTKIADVSCEPSVNTGCWHGYVTGGKVSWC